MNFKILLKFSKIQCHIVRVCRTTFFIGRFSDFAQRRFIHTGSDVMQVYYVN